jgi:hypothetical protein
LSTDDRIWVATGTTITGIAPGRPDIAWAPISAGRGITVKDRKRITENIAAALNADGEPPPLTANEESVLAVVIAHQAQYDYPAQISKVCELTGLKRPTVSNIFDRLVDRGLGTRPPKNDPTTGRVLHRPFTAKTPAVTR